MLLLPASARGVTASITLPTSVAIRENGYGIATDNAGNAYITGDTVSAATDHFPIVNAFQPDLGGAVDAFFAMLNTNVGLNSVFYSTYFGGTASDWGYLSLDHSIPPVMSLAKPAAM